MKGRLYHSKSSVAYDGRRRGTLTDVFPRKFNQQNEVHGNPRRTNKPVLTRAQDDRGCARHGLSWSGRCLWADIWMACQSVRKPPKHGAECDTLSIRSLYPNSTPLVECQTSRRTTKGSIGRTSATRSHTRSSCAGVKRPPALHCNHNDDCMA